MPMAANDQIEAALDPIDRDGLTELQ